MRNYSPYDPIKSVSDILAQAKMAQPSMLPGGDALKADYVGEVGPMPSQPQPQTFTLPPPNEPVSPEVPSWLQPRPFVGDVSNVAAKEDRLPPPVLRSSPNGAQQPNSQQPQPQPDLSGQLDDTPARALKRSLALRMISSGSPSQQVHAMSMIDDLNKPNTLSYLAAVNASDADETAKARARTLIKLGADAKDIAGALGYDEKGRKAAAATKQARTKALTQYAADTLQTAHLQKAADLASSMIDEYPHATGTVGGLAKWAQDNKYMGVGLPIQATPAYRLMQPIDTIRAIVGFDRIQQLKEMSKTGSSGLGAVSNVELHFLQATQGSLDISQKPEVLKRNIEDVVRGKRIIDKIKAIAPALEEGSAEAEKQYTKLVSELGDISANVSSRDSRVHIQPAPEGSKGREIENRYGL